MEGGGTWGLKPGQWTDDTSMALCLASSLITRRGYDPYDQMVRYKWWYKDGYMSSTGSCFDIGNATRDSLDEFIHRQKSLRKYFPGKEDELDSLSMDEIKSVTDFNVNCSSDGVAGNGALMRLAPVPLFFYRYPEIAVEYAGCSARLTHGDKKAVDACRYYAALIVAAVRGEPKESILSKRFYEDHPQWFGSVKLHAEILRVAQGSYRNSKGYDGGIRGKGYIVNALEAALWAFWSDENSFEKGALAAVNLGDDTDTTAAIYGQLAGAFYGCDRIPNHWRKKLYAYELLKCIGQCLYSEGTRYNPTEKKRKMISLGQSSTKTSLDQHQQTQTSSLSMNLTGINLSQGNPPSGRELPRDRLSPREIPVQHSDSRRYQPRYLSEAKVTPRHLDNTGMLANRSYISQSPVYPRPGQQLSMHNSDAHRTPIYRSDPVSNVGNSTRHSYYAGQTGQDMPAYNNLAGYESTRRYTREPDPYYRPLSINPSTSANYDTDFITENRPFQTSSTSSPTTFYSDGRLHHTRPVYKYPYY
jgi:ADP-ribosylglycohydrolase